MAVKEDERSLLEVDLPFMVSFDEKQLGDEDFVGSGLPFAIGLELSKEMDGCDESILWCPNKSFILMLSFSKQTFIGGGSAC